MKKIEKELIVEITQMVDLLETEIPTKGAPLALFLFPALQKLTIRILNIYIDSHCKHDWH